jgi:peptidoglycan/xylan/chitin deacetylase (PgdA/CDA1 family)
VDRLGIGRLALGSTWRGVVTFSYHRFAPASVDPPASASATAETLGEQMRLLRDHCEVLSPDQLTHGALAQRGRRVIVTVDDCYRDAYEVALPVFAAAAIPATFFLVPGFLDARAQPWWDEIEWMVAGSRRDRLASSEWWGTELPLRGSGVASTVTALVGLRSGMGRERGEEMLNHLGTETGSGRRPLESATREFITWEQAREMAAAGMIFGGHTDTHPVLVTLPAEEQRTEIERGLDRMTTELGVRPDAFAYPVGLQGTFDASTKAALVEAGVRVAFSNYGGYTRPHNWDLLEVRRLGVSLETTEASFRWTVGLPAMFAREWSPGRFQLHTPA